jgi:peptidoglycan hydrolase-like protein with peptidoglycan-binding domain
MTKKFTYGDAPVQPDPDVFIFYRELKRGMKGQDVVELKKLLIAKGYKDGITIDTKTSPNFGPTTKTLVKQFQADNGLTVDGIAGPQTITALGGYFR